MEEVINEVASVATNQNNPAPVTGSAGLETQLPGQAATVSGLAGASGGIGGGNLFLSELDEQLFKFEGDETPLMQLILLSKKVPVTSPIVEHPLLDEERIYVTTNGDVSESSAHQAVMPLDSNDQPLAKLYDTLRVRGVNGYSEDGQTETPGADLMLYVTGHDATSNNPIVRAVNGPKTNKTDGYCTIPAIPAGTLVDILSPAMSETQRVVPPYSSVPAMEQVFLQKRGMNHIVSDYFDSQKKRVPFTNALLAERAIHMFKESCERSYWVGAKGVMKVKDDDTGIEDVYFSKGIRWMFRREIKHSGKWTYEEFVAMAKMFYNSKVDVPKGCICLAGDNFMEGIQLIDFSKHPEVKISVERDRTLGWDITRIHTLFGDFDFKRCASLTRLGYSNSCAIIGTDRLVNYVRSNDHSEKDRIEGHEASRTSLIRWDAPALKGTCNLFVNGEGTDASTSAVPYILWKDSTAPDGDDLVDGTVYYFLQEVSLSDTLSAKPGQTWKYSVSGDTGSWSEYMDEIKAE